MSEIKLGVQLYTLRDHIKTYEDTEKTFMFLQDIGVNIIQISGIGPIEPKKVAHLVEKYNMDVCVTHKAYERMLNDLDNLIDEHLMIGCDCIGVGGMPSEYRNTADGVREFIKQTEKIGKHMQKRGVHFNYHNHDFEFNYVDGRRIIDMLIEDTDPELFWFVPDVAWIKIAGEDPSEYIKKMQNRVKVLHFKDYNIIDNKHSFTEIGLGCMDLVACYRTCLEMKIPYIVYEQDNGFSENPIKSTEISYKNMKNIALEASS